MRRLSLGKWLESHECDQGEENDFSQLTAALVVLQICWQ